MDNENVKSPLLPDMVSASPRSLQCSSFGFCFAIWSQRCLVPHQLKAKCTTYFGQRSKNGSSECPNESKSSMNFQRITFELSKDRRRGLPGQEPDAKRIPRLSLDSTHHSCCLSSMKPHEYLTLYSTPPSPR